MDKMKYIKAAITAIFSAVMELLGFSGVLFLILFLLAAIDVVTGYVSACKRGVWESGKSKAGVLKKFGMFALVISCGVLDVVLQIVSSHLFYVDFISVKIMPFVTVWYILTEFGSIMENCALCGVAIPAWLEKILSVCKNKLVEKAGGENDEENS